MFFLLFGEDSYRSRQKLNEIVQQYKEKNKRGLNLFFFDCNCEANFDFGDLEIAVKQTSMFVEKKLLVISNFLSSGTEDGQEKMINLLKAFSPSLQVQRSNLDGKEEARNDGRACPPRLSESGSRWRAGTPFFIFFETTKTINAQNKLFKFLKQNKDTKIQEFKLLKGLELSNWIAGEFSKYNLKIQKDALHLFLDFVGNDLWKIKNEINKLANYCKDKREVGIDDIKLLVQAKIDNDIFNTIEAIANKNENKSLKLIDNHIQKGDNMFYILSMIAYQFKNLLMIRDLIDKSKNYNEINKELKMHPFVFKKSYKLANLFKTIDLKNIYNKILETDLKIKQGGFNPPQLGIELLILKPFT